MEEDREDGDSSREATLAKLLALEREKRVAAETLAERERQAILQLKSLLLDQSTVKRDNGLPLSSPGRHQPEQQPSRSMSSSSGFGSPLPRAFSQEFFDTVLHDLSDDIQLTLGTMDHTAAEFDPSIPTTPFSKASAAINCNDPKKLCQVIQEDSNSGADSDQIIIKYGTQLLNAAIERGYTGCVRVLLEAGCSPNEAGLSTLPPLLTAAKNGHTSCLKVLLEYGAEVNISDSKGHTALYLSLLYGHRDCISVLLKAKPNVASVTMTGETLLHAAVLGNMDSVLRLLLVEIRATCNSSGVSRIVNKQGLDGDTPLHLAVSKGYKSCVEILCAIKEVDANLLNSKGNTPLDLAGNDCQLILTTKDAKEARVAVLTGENGHPRLVIGRVRVLPHHSWDDVNWLVRGTLQEYGCLLSDSIDPVFDDGTQFPFSSSHHSRKDNLSHLIQLNGEKLAEEMKSVVRLRLSALAQLELDQFMESCHVGDHKREEDDKMTPFEALVNQEDSGELCEVTVTLKPGIERIAFLSLHPITLLKDYTEVLMKNECLILHGPPESDLNVMLGQISACLKTTASSPVDKVLLPLSPHFSRAHLISLLYDNGLLQPVSDTSEEDISWPGCSLLVMEGIEKLQQYDSLTELHMLLTRYKEGEGVWLDINDHTHQSSVPPGKYQLARQCYVIATRTLFTSTNQRSLPQEVMNCYAHIWLSDSAEPALGSIFRQSIRELINTRKGTLPSKSDYMYQAIVWVWQFWMLYNYYMTQLELFQLTIGTKLFLNCPVQSNNPDSIYNWFVELWSYHLVPKLKEVLLKSNASGKQKTSKANACKQLMFFLVYRVVQITCPLPSEASHDFVLALHGDHDLSSLLSSSVKDNPTVSSLKENGVDKKSPKVRKLSLKKASTVSEWADLEESTSQKEQSSEGSLSHSAKDKKSLKASRPKSGGLFSKNSTLRKSLFKGSRASLYAVEEEDATSKNKTKKQKHDENIEDLFDVLMAASSKRLDEQRMSSTGNTPPANRSPAHSLTKHESIRPSSADKAASHSPIHATSTPTTLHKTHPRISNLVTSHTLPRQRSRSEDNVYLSSHNDLSRPSSSETSFHHQHHHRQISTSSDALSDSFERRSSTDSLTNSFSHSNQPSVDYNSSNPASKYDGDDIVHDNDESDQFNVSNTSSSASNYSRSLSPRTRRMSRSYQMLYSASLGYCASISPSSSRKISVPVMSTTSAVQPSQSVRRLSTALSDWSMDCVEM